MTKWILISIIGIIIITIGSGYIVTENSRLSDAQVQIDDCSSEEGIEKQRHDVEYRNSCFEAHLIKLDSLDKSTKVGFPILIIGIIITVGGIAMFFTRPPKKPEETQKSKVIEERIQD